MPKSVSVHMKDASVKSILDKISAEAGLEYTIMGEDLIVISPRRNNSVAKVKGQPLATGLKGRVIDETGEPIIGASVIVKGSTNGVSTNLDGEFSLSNVHIGDVVNVSYIGYHTQSVRIKDASGLNVVLQPSATNLDEVVVVGYGVQRKRDVTTSISSLKGDDLVDMPANSIEQALVGRMSGVQVTQGTGMPGGGMSIKVRGTGTVTAGSDPLLCN